MSNHRESLRVEREVADNGLVLLVNEREDAELIVVQGTYLSGPVFDPRGKSGLSRFTSEMMMRGTRRRNYSRVIDEVESIGAGIRFYSGEDVSWSSARCTPQTFDKTMEILMDCTANPVFPDEEIEKVRGIMLTRIMQREDNTMAVAGRLAKEMLFPKNNPYHNDPGGTEETISSITREDVDNFHKKQYGSNSAILTFSGNVTLDEVRRAVERHSGDWEPVKKNPRIPNTAVSRPVKPGTKVHPMAQKSQSDIAVICPAMERGHDDHYAMDLANVVLGRIGLMGRLGKNIREKQGLAYYAMSNYFPRITSGYWMALAGVNPANVDRTIASIFKEMDRISEKPITRREYSDVMTNRVGSMALRLETCSGVAGFMQNIERHQLGLDYADRYEGFIRSVTLEDITRVCAENLKTGEAISAVAGPTGG